jgi:hypothetical protein
MEGAADASKMRVTLHTHSILQVLSVWINEEFDTGAAGFSADSVIPRGMPSATQIGALGTMLNTFGAQHMPVMGMGVPTAQGSLHRTYGYAAADAMTTQVDYLSRTANWQIFYTFGEKYEEPIDGTTLEEDRLWQRVGIYPFLLPGGKAVHEILGLPQSLKVTIDYQACITKDRGRDVRFHVALVFLLFLSESPSEDMRNSAGAHFQRLVHVVDLTDKVFKMEDINGHTRWAGMAVGDEAGRNSISPNWIQGTQTVAWPSEVLEDGWPWHREIIDFPLDDFIENEMPPEHWLLHVCVSYYTWQTEGQGTRPPFNIFTLANVEQVEENVNASGCIIIPCVSVKGTPYQY